MPHPFVPVWCVRVPPVEDLAVHHTTIEEREEYEQHINNGACAQMREYVLPVRLGRAFVLASPWGGGAHPSRGHPRKHPGFTASCRTCNLPGMMAEPLRRVIQPLTASCLALVAGRRSHFP
jgi:hypothetical protein